MSGSSTFWGWGTGGEYDLKNASRETVPSPLTRFKGHFLHKDSVKKKLQIHCQLTLTLRNRERLLIFRVNPQAGARRIRSPRSSASQSVFLLFDFFSFVLDFLHLFLTDC